MRMLLVTLLILFSSACALNNVSKPELHFQRELNVIQEQFELPGISAYYVFNDGRGTGAYSGFADVEAGRALSARSKMLGASTGKSFVGAITIQLFIEESLNLDEPIFRWLGHYEWFERLPNHQFITLRHLLTHSSGISDHVYEDAFHQAFIKSLGTEENLFTPEDLIGYILDKPPLFSPGTSWSYSDTGYLLIGLVLEKVTGRQYYELVNERFIDPLKLTSTTPAIRRNIDDLVVGYISQENTFSLPRRTLNSRGRLHWHPEVEWTGGGFATSARDLALWGAALFSGKIMEDNYLSLLLTGVDIDSGNSSVRYGAGVVINQSGKFGTTYGHSGWIPGYVSSFHYYEDLELTIALQINTDDMMEGSEENVLQIIEERLVAALITD